MSNGFGVRYANAFTKIPASAGIQREGAQNSVHVGVWARDES
jgi:hypothetical protein